MYSYGLIQEQTWLDKIFVEHERTAFEITQEETECGQHVAVFQDKQMVGGITLEYISNIQEDHKISKYWDVKEPLSAVKMKRLWALPGNKKAFLKIFHAVTEIVGGDTLLLGVLALPLSFVEKTDYEQNNVDLMTPKKSLAQYRWDSELQASSEGQKLMRSYLTFGAKVLGPLCACPEDHSVRVCLGMYLHDIPTERIKCYV